MAKITKIMLALLIAQAANGQPKIVMDNKMVASLGRNLSSTMSALSPMAASLEEAEGHKQSIARKAAAIAAIRQRMLDSRSKVSGRVSGGAHLAMLHTLAKDIARYQKQALENAKGDPKLLLVAYKAESELLGRVASLLAHAYQNAVSGGAGNLLVGTKRVQVLREAIQELKAIRAIAYAVNRRMALAKRAGLLATLPPPSRIDNDKQIVDKILGSL